MRILFIDTETTGLPNEHIEGCGKTHSPNGYPRPVQVSWILTETDGTVVSKETAYIRPKDFTMPPRATSVNHIGQRMLETYGKDEFYVMLDLVRAAGKADMIAGHNIGFDISVISGRLTDMAEKYDMKFLAMAKRLKEMPTRDTMTESAQWCALAKVPGRKYDYPGKFKYPRLSELYEKLYGHGYEDEHDAGADTKAAMECFFKLVIRGIIPRITIPQKKIQK